MDVQLPRFVLLVEVPVCLFIEIPVDDAPFSEKTTPQIITVAANQGIVEVKQGNAHKRSLPDKNAAKHSGWWLKGKMLVMACVICSTDAAVGR